MIARLLAAAGLLLAAAGLPASATEPAEPPRKAALETFEGVVTALEDLPAESGLPVVAVDLDRGDGAEPTRVLLAPRSVLEEIEFTVEVGDRLKVRVFAGGSPPLSAQRVLNESHGSLVRLRTLSHTPLWSSTGVWQGGQAHGYGGFGPGGRSSTERPRNAGAGSGGPGGGSTGGPGGPQGR